MAELLGSRGGGEGVQTPSTAGCGHPVHFRGTLESHVGVEGCKGEAQGGGRCSCSHPQPGGTPVPTILWLSLPFPRPLRAPAPPSVRGHGVPGLMALPAGGRGAEVPPRVLQLPQLPRLHRGRGHLRAGGALQALLVRLGWAGGLGGRGPRHHRPPSRSAPRSGHCYYQMVVTPVIEQILPDSPASRIPHTVTLVSIPACSDGKRGFSVSIDQGCGTEHPRTVRVRECVPVPSAPVPSCIPCPLCHRPLPRAGASRTPSVPGIHSGDTFWGGMRRDGAGGVPIVQGWPVGTAVACPQLQGGLWGLCWCVPGHAGIAPCGRVG